MMFYISYKSKIFVDLMLYLKKLYFIEINFIEIKQFKQKCFYCNTCCDSLFHQVHICCYSDVNY